MSLAVIEALISNLEQKNQQRLEACVGTRGGRETCQWSDLQCSDDLFSVHQTRGHSHNE